MNVMMITSLNTYTANMKMQTKWQQKKSSGDFTADGAMTMEERLLKDAREAMGGPMGSGSRISISSIQTKLMSGKKLSSEEMDYLRDNNPELYKKAKSIEMEREAYERELKQCKTKEDVERVKLAHTTAALAQVKDAESNPSLSKGQKLGLIMEQLFKLNAIGDVQREFVESGEYSSLPTEEEERQAREDLKEAREAELGIEDRTDSRTDDMPREASEDVRAEENTGQVPEEYISAADQNGHGAKAKKVTENTYGPNVRSSKAPSSKAPMTRAQAQATPEARKVKRARAQAAYAKTPKAEGAAGKILDVKK